MSQKIDYPVYFPHKSTHSLMDCTQAILNVYTLLKSYEWEPQKLSNVNWGPGASRGGPHGVPQKEQDYLW